MAKEINVAALDMSHKIEMYETIFDHMRSKMKGLGQSGYMLGGDTGVGKTSFVRDMGALLGLNIIIIETPHIVEEHLIDIPFIVVKPSGAQKRDDVTVDTKKAGNEFDIQFAQSHLYTQLKEAKKVTDAELLKTINARQELMRVWKELGGSETKIPAIIAQVRAHFEVILFLDEYFRQTTTTIRNMLRSILNGRIGTNRVPDNVYIIFASNLVDQGVGDILENEDFKMMDFDTPDTDDWFGYIISKHPKMDKALLHSFYELLKKNKGSLSLDDFNADVRVSPRRWEQLLIYIDANMPVKSNDEAHALLKNIELSFKNYQDGVKASIAKDVLKSVKELLAEQSDGAIKGDEKAIGDDDWRETLRHQIQTRIKAGPKRKYIPVVAGLPGAGKTQNMVELATDLNLVPVFIDVQNLSPEEVIGTPVAKTGEKMEVKFSRPPLWDQIQVQMKEGEAHLKARLEKFKGAEEGAKLFKQWKGASVKYLIFFDELNRTNTKVFNAIRKVILEKEFNEEYRLPEESVVVAAINPTGKGTQELTKHVRDVFDVIPVHISWPKFKAHLDKMDLGVDDDSARISRTVLSAFIDRFRVRESQQGADPHFFLNVSSTPIYVSAREYTDMLVGIAHKMQRVYGRELEKLGDPEHKPEDSEEKVRRAIYSAAKDSLHFILKHKHGLESPDFMHDLEDWFMYSEDIDIGHAFKKAVESVKTLEEIMGKPFSDHTKHLSDDVEFVNYISSVDQVKFKEDVEEYLTKLLQSGVEMFTDKRPTKTLSKGKFSIDADKLVTEIEYIVREMLHAIKLHDVSNKMTDIFAKTTREVMANGIDLLDPTADPASYQARVKKVLAISRAINALIKELAK